jgi:2-methylcitrate dehydratase PrpD
VTGFPAGSPGEHRTRPRPRQEPEELRLETADPIVTLISHVRSTRFEDLPARVVDVVKKAIVDTVGAGIAGSSAAMGRLVTDMVRDYGGRRDSTLWVHGDKVPAPEAAFANAIMARCRELDDVHEGTPRVGIGHGGHVSVMVVPAALAAVECMARPVTGQELIAAIAVGGDLIPRMRMAAGDAGRVGWEAPTIAPFGVAATIGKLHHFDEELFANAMGAAYAHCSGTILSTSDGTWDVWLNAGMAARAGMIAAELARRGHQGAKSPLLGGAGLYPLYFRKEYHEDALLSDLGTEFESANVSVKPYSSCKCTHHTIYTVLEMMKRHGFRGPDIERIAVRTCDYNMWLVVLNEKGEPKYAPRNLNEAQFSMPFTMATAIVKGTVFSDVLTEDTLSDPDILRLARTISVEVTAEKNELMKKEGYPPDDVDVYTRDGRVFRGCEPYVKGHPQNPMTFDEVVEKFERCAALSARPLSAKALDAFVADVRALDSIADVRGLVPSLHENA